MRTSTARGALIGVVGATGQVGGAAARTLVAAGVRPRLLVRDPDRLPAALRAASDVVRADLADPDAVVDATAGLRALLWLTPNAPAAPDLAAHLRTSGALAARVVRQHQVRHVVLISAAGAERDDLGVISLQRHVEQALRATGAALTILRPAYFYENVLRQLDALRADGAVYEPYDERAVVPMVATEDVGRAAAEALLEVRPQELAVRELAGPDRHTVPEAVAAFGAALGRPFRYVRIPVEAVAQTLVQHGASASVVAAYVAMVRGLGAAPLPAAGASGASGRKRTPRVQAVTTPTTAAAFARAVLAPALAITLPLPPGGDGAPPRHIEGARA